MYQYSLDWYITLYELAIEQAEKAKNLDDRLRNLNDCFAYLLYKNVCRPLSLVLTHLKIASST